MLLRREMLMGAVAFAVAPGAWAQQTTPVPQGTDRQGPPPLWGPPYTRQELLEAEKRFGIRFPPDLFDFLLQRRFARSLDWTTDNAAIRELFEWPLQGILVDIERNDFWAPYWGPRPATLQERLATAGRLVKAAPKLIPLGPNHFIPEAPFERGNPVFLVFLTDVNYAGADLAAFVKRLETPPRQRGPVTGPRKRIPFWTELSEVRSAPPKPKAQPKSPAPPPAGPERG